MPPYCRVCIYRIYDSEKEFSSSLLSSPSSIHSWKKILTLLLNSRRRNQTRTLRKYTQHCEDFTTPLLLFFHSCLFSFIWKNKTKRLVGRAGVFWIRPTRKFPQFGNISHIHPTENKIRWKTAISKKLRYVRWCKDSEKYQEKRSKMMSMLFGGILPRH